MGAEMVLQISAWLLLAFALAAAAFDSYVLLAVIVRLSWDSLSWHEVVICGALAAIALGIPTGGVVLVLRGRPFWAAGVAGVSLGLSWFGFTVLQAAFIP